jgi:SAM-dependent methyltransferase
MARFETPTLSDVQAFWDTHPLFVGESTHEAGSKRFFDEHKDLYHKDVFAGKLNNWAFPPLADDLKILDVGCGIGFWLVEFWERGYRNIYGIDISPRSIELARKRCTLYGATAHISVGNAEQMQFADASFDHVNCFGVIHHTPHPQDAVREIYRVLKPGGTAGIAVYYRNALLRNWATFHKLMRPLSLGLRGRGRESISQTANADELVRLYDGQDNPIGHAYTRAQVRALLSPFTVQREYLHFFPARALRLAPSGTIHRIADVLMPFMIGVFVKKTA